MKSQNYSLHSMQSWSQNDIKIANTPQTAQSLEQNPQFSGNKEISFSSIIFHVDQYFLAQESNIKESEQSKQMADSISKQTNFGSQKSSQTIQCPIQSQQQVFQKFELILSNSKDYCEEQIQFETLNQSIIRREDVSGKCIGETNQKNSYTTANTDEMFVVVKLKLETQKFNLENFDQIRIDIRMKSTGYRQQIYPTVNLFKGPSSKDIFLKPTIKVISPQIIQFQFSNEIISQTYQTSKLLLNKSNLLNEVVSLQQLRGLLFQLSKQNMGSRIIQKLIYLKSEESMKLLKNQILKEKQHIVSMMMDKYGNYIIQKMFCNMQTEQKTNFLSGIKNSIVNIAMDQYGTFCLQHLLMKCNRIKQCVQIVEKSLVQRLNQVSLNEHSTFFLHYLINFTNAFVIQSHFLTKQNFILNVKSKYGILTLKCILKKACSQKFNKNERKLRLLQLTYESFEQIVDDEYGHFFVEQLLRHCQFDQLNWVLWKFVSKLQYYCNNLFASNVIRTYLEAYPYIWTPTLISYIFYSTQLPLSLMNNKSGSFILHKLIQKTDFISRERILLVLKGLLGQLVDDQRRQSWNKFFGEMSYYKQ